MNILIVEDNIDVSSVLMESIQHWGYSAENADTCKDALGKVKEKRFDLILLDIFLPDGKGHRLIPQFKELWPDAGIVTMTSYNTRELEMEVREQGIFYYMIKPFETKSLKELLDHISHKYSKKADNEIDFQVRKEVILTRRQTIE
jgi:DNA-binding NtrC family response regulator